MLLLAAPLLVSCTTSAPEPTPPAITADPVEVCAQFSDVGTIIFNAGSGLRDGRMAEQEYQGWLRLAARVLSRIDADDTTDLGAAIAAAQAAAPAVPIGIVQDVLDPLSSEWTVAQDSVRAACSAAGAEVVGEGFTGG